MGEEIEFKGYEQDQGQLFPAHLSEALDASDPVFFIDDFVEGLDLLAFEERYGSMGERAYPPRMLLKLWLFGAIEGVYSGREIARRLRWDLRFRYLAGGLVPDPERPPSRWRDRTSGTPSGARALLLDDRRVVRCVYHRSPTTGGIRFGDSSRSGRERRADWRHRRLDWSAQR